MKVKAGFDRIWTTNEHKTLKGTGCAFDFMKKSRTPQMTKHVNSQFASQSEASHLNEANSDSTRKLITYLLACRETQVK